jgi:hypothetical protein
MVAVSHGKEEIQEKQHQKNMRGRKGKKGEFAVLRFFSMRG